MSKELCYRDCDRPNYVSYRELSDYVGSLGEGFPYGFHCVNCDKPYCYNSYPEFNNYHKR